ncbi:MAG: site-2 protease family protein [Bacillota bacterium]|uniref:Site-2 protease family protein n=1 Tax=Virgibacillus salarius TaxID=447199 RepID=A0A941DWX3_9BACI|nr:MULTISPECIES: site-2 protease family protein [Bacillaceae]NAZ09667.1 stage IV sporulation protein FB [Agaribacter marinus]MBR7796957.1 site-2 protease family protein [Virgibacillus salarius]MCC2251125.1 site-2 protease family protein [Virgibacillus sp. AGTR]MDY7045296.1 site-2 protease family protein [Virgibacillus sp. M23]QRZ17564.1 site-2 protease family protein [Virgibacillus sp. AGTR]
MSNNYLPHIHFHPILLVFIIISFFTGTFMELAILLFIVFFHEMGHFMMATFFKWRIRKVMLWVFGGVMDTDEHGSKPIREELLVTCAGPFQHIILFIVLFLLGDLGMLPQAVMDLFLYYNSIILLFNLLPLWPLDGGKLLFLCLSSLVPYKKAYYAVIIFSMIASILLLLIQLITLPFTLSSFFIFIFLFMENKTEWKQRYYAFFRFLLKRYEGKNRFARKVLPIRVSSDQSLLEVFSRFHREKLHPIYIIYPNNYRQSIDEVACLHSYFNEKHYDKTVGEIARNLI